MTSSNKPVKIRDLVEFDLKPDETLTQEVSQYFDGIRTEFNFLDIKIKIDLIHEDLVNLLKRYRAFLRAQKSELRLFQILQIAANFVNYGKYKSIDREFSRELYLETYMAIIWYANNIKKFDTYKMDLPEKDRLLFLGYILDEGNGKNWGNYKTDYVDRLRFSCQYPSHGQDMTEYMFFVYITAKQANVELVNNAKRKEVQDLRLKLKDPYKTGMKPEVGGYPSTSHNLIIGNLISGFVVYYISPGRVFLRHPKIQDFLFVISSNSVADRQFNDFWKLLYENTKGLLPAIELFFKFIVYLPILIEAGPVALVYEVATDLALEKTTELVREYNPTAARILDIATIFKPSPKGLLASPANRNLGKLEQDLPKITGTDRALISEHSRMIDRPESGSTGGSGSPGVGGGGLAGASSGSPSAGAGMGASGGGVAGGVGARSTGTPTQPTFLQRSRAAALEEQALNLENEARKLTLRAEEFENKATRVDVDPINQANYEARANLARSTANKKLENAASIRREATEYRRGTRSATADLPGPEDIDALFEHAHPELDTIIKIQQSAAAKDPEKLVRLIRPLTRSRTGNRVVYRVEGGGSRELITITEGGNVTLSNNNIHLNFGSEARAIEFLAKRDSGRIVVFEVDERLVQSFRSVALPEFKVKSAEFGGRLPQLVDIRYADDQMFIPKELLGLLDEFIIPGSGRVLEITQ
jgi:hypothetical protein